MQVFEHRERTRNGAPQALPTRTPCALLRAAVEAVAASAILAQLVDGEAGMDREATER